jgi:hypothetical protein
LPVGSGTVERAWQHRVSARLTLAGMIWDMPGAEAVAVVRAWLKSDRRDDALRLCLPPALVCEPGSPPARAGGDGGLMALPPLTLHQPWPPKRETLRHTPSML